MQEIYLSGILLAWLSVFMVVAYYLYQRNYKYEIAANIEDSKVSGILADTITNSITIKTFASLEREYDLVNNVVTKRKIVTRTKWFRAMIIRTTTALFTIGIEFSMFYSAILFWKQGVLSIGIFVLLQIYLFRILDQMRSIGNVFRHLYQSI